MEQVRENARNAAVMRTIRGHCLPRPFGSDLGVLRLVARRRAKVGTVRGTAMRLSLLIDTPGTRWGWRGEGGASRAGSPDLLEHFLESCRVLWQLLARLAADDQRDEQLADPVSLERESDGDA